MDFPSRCERVTAIPVSSYLELPCCILAVGLESGPSPRKSWTGRTTFTQSVQTAGLDQILAIRTGLCRTLFLSLQQRILVFDAYAMYMEFIYFFFRIACDLAK